MEDLYYDPWPDHGKIELEATQVDDEGLAQGPAEGEGDRSAGKGVAAGGMVVARGTEGANDGVKDAHGAEDVYDGHRDDDTEDEEDIEDIQTLPPPTPAKERSEIGDELDADIEEGMDISSFESEEGSTGMSGASSDRVGPGASPDKMGRGDRDGKASAAESASNGSKAKSKRPRADAGSKGQQGPGELACLSICRRNSRCYTAAKMIPHSHLVLEGQAFMPFLINVSLWHCSCRDEEGENPCERGGVLYGANPQRQLSRPEARV